MSHTHDVVIIGGGVIGCSIAYFLAVDHGLRCLIIERDAVASGASGGAAGELGAVGRHRFSETFTRFLMTGIEMHEQMASVLREESGIDYLLSDIPLLRPAFDEQEALDLQEQMDWQHKLGLNVEWLDASNVHTMSTWLSTEAIGAAFTIEKQLEAYPFAIALAQACERYGVEIRTAEVSEIARHGDAVDGVELTSGETVGADAVVVANGPWVQQSTRWLGMNVPVVPLKGQIVHAAPPKGVEMPRHAIFHETGYVLPKASGDLLIGTTQERAGFDVQPTMEAQNNILESVVRLAPLVMDAPIQDLTACLRPYSEDELPIMGPIPGAHSLYLATGHGYKGVTLALATGKSMAQLIATGKSDIKIDEFSPARFSLNT